MGATILGIVLIVIGVIALLGGIGGGMVQMFLNLREEARRGPSGLFDFPTQIIDSLVKLLEALAKAPIWLALTIIGILLIAFGGYVLPG